MPRFANTRCTFRRQCPWQLFSGRQSGCSTVSITNQVLYVSL